MNRSQAVTAASTAVVTVLIATVAVGASVVVDGASDAAVLAAGGAGIIGAVLLGLARARQPERPDAQERKPVGHLGYPCACADPKRRKLLQRSAVGGAVLLGGLALLPLWRSTQRAERRLRRTSWSNGARLVDDRGRQVRVGDLQQGSFATVWPAGHQGDGDSPAVLIRLHPGRRVTSPGRNDWLADGHVAYSKLCTHMGCPVGLYQSQADLLVCPCHQATFDVLRGVVPTQGPAKRALPQLPLSVDADGYIIATGDFPNPVGPGYWSRPA